MCSSDLGWKTFNGIQDNDWGGGNAAWGGLPPASWNAIKNRPAANSIYSVPQNLNYSFTGVHRERLNGQAMALLEEVGLGEFADVHAGELAYGRKRALEIATTLAMNPELMLLDEPTQGMGHEDVDRVTQLIKKVGANRTILMVEHNMNVVSSIADTISVLQRGQVIAEGPYEVVSQNPQVLEAYVGAVESA